VAVEEEAVEEEEEEEVVAVEEWILPLMKNLTSLMTLRRSTCLRFPPSSGECPAAWRRQDSHSRLSTRISQTIWFSSLANSPISVART